MMDQEFLRSLIEHKYEGACFHCYASTYFKKIGLPGYGAMHKQHAKEEHQQYLDLMEMYAEQFGDMPMINKVEPNGSLFRIDDSANFAQKMEQGLEIYEDYEKEALEFFKQHKRQIGEDPYIMELIKKTKNELKFIEELDDEMENNGYNPEYLSKLDKWLVKKYNKDGNQVRDKYMNYARSGGNGGGRGGNSGNYNYQNYGYDNYGQNQNYGYNNYNRGGQYNYGNYGSSGRFGGMMM